MGTEYAYRTLFGLICMGIGYRINFCVSCIGDDIKDFWNQRIKAFNQNIAHPKGLELRWTEDMKSSNTNFIEYVILTLLQKETIQTWKEFNRYLPSLDLVKLPKPKEVHGTTNHQVIECQPRSMLPKIVI